MKIRTDFVTNSSSSNFTIEICLWAESGGCASFYEDPFQIDDNGDDVGFSADLPLIWREVTLKLGEKFKSVKDLAQYLMDSEYSSIFDNDEPDQDEYDECREYYDRLREYKEDIMHQKEEFVKDACEMCQSIDDISALEIDRRYTAYDHDAEWVAYYDSELRALAEKVVTSIGDERKKALEEMAAYVNAPNPDRQGGEFFAEGCEIEYEWSGNPDDLLPVARRLFRGPRRLEFVSGTEERVLDFKRGKMTNHATVDLDL